jgi:hypothetical protein
MSEKNSESSAVPPAAAMPGPDGATPPAAPVAPATPAGPPRAAELAGPTPRLVTVGAIQWQNALEFVHLFRGFRLAMNPAKLVVALLTIVLIYASGRLFDFAWGHQVYADELMHFVSDSPEAYRARRATNLKERDIYFRGDPSAVYAELKTAYRQDFAKALDAAHQQHLAAEAALAHLDPSIRVAVPPVSPEDVERNARKAAADALLQRMEQLNDIRGQGIFQTFIAYETAQFNRLVDNTLVFARIAPAAPNGMGSPGQAILGGLFSRDPDQALRSDTVVGCLANMTITGPRWLFVGAAPMQWRPDTADNAGGSLKTTAYHGLYLASVTVLAVFWLVMLALAGASIARLSALELAGVERPPLKDVGLFAIRRLGVFIKAPVAPFLILLVIGLGMAVVGMIGAVPYVGPVLIGLVLFVFLAVSFVLMLLLLGIVGGFNLLYPTIAVEGSDSFDAMSRSFAYVYARPWRLLFYSVISLIYGMVTFMFISFAVYLIFILTHTFLGWGMGLFGAHDGSMSGVSALQTIWPEPTFANLVMPVNWYAMDWPEWIGSMLLHFWVYLLMAGLGAFVLSYYFSSHTIIYLLLRRSVDGQNLREIYLEDK